VLAALVDKSLVVLDTAAPDGRYRMLETIRAFAGEQLAQQGQDAELRRRHAEFFTAWAGEAEGALRGPQQAAWLTRLAFDHDNLRAAREWALGSGAPDLALALAGVVRRVWNLRGHLTEGRRWLDRVLAQSGGESAARARVLNGAGVLAWTQGDLDTARRCHEESLAVRRALDDQPGIAESLNNLGNVTLDQGDADAARALYEASLAQRQALGDTWGTAMTLNNRGTLAGEQGDSATAQIRFEESLALFRVVGDTWAIAMTLHNLGDEAQNRGELAQARRLHEESLGLRRELADKRGITASLINLGWVALAQGDLDSAGRLYAESLALLRELGDKRVSAFCLEGLAATATLNRQADRAARLFGAAAALREAIGVPLEPVDRADYERYVAQGRDQLPPEGWTPAWESGYALSLDQAIAYALGESGPAGRVING
jgi:tetratricopeptide (TPR) repeat protein